MLNKTFIPALILLKISNAGIGQENVKNNTVKAGDILRDLIPLTALGTTVFYEKGTEGTIQLVKSYITAVVGILRSFYFTKPDKGITIAPFAASGYFGVNFGTNL